MSMSNKQKALEKEPITQWSSLEQNPSPYVFVDTSAAPGTIQIMRDSTLEVSMPKNDLSDSVYFVPATPASKLV